MKTDLDKSIYTVDSTTLYQIVPNSLGLPQKKISDDLITNGKIVDL